MWVFVFEVFHINKSIKPNIFPFELKETKTTIAFVAERYEETAEERGAGLSIGRDEVNAMASRLTEHLGRAR